VPIKRKVGYGDSDEEINEARCKVKNMDIRVYQGLPKTDGVSKMGHMGSGTVLDLAHCDTLCTHTAVSWVFTGILVS
jgi:hypothetical protein